MHVKAAIFVTAFTFSLTLIYSVLCYKVRQQLLQFEALCQQCFYTTLEYCWQLSLTNIIELVGMTVMFCPCNTWGAMKSAHFTQSITLVWIHFSLICLYIYAVKMHRAVWQNQYNKQSILIHLFWLDLCHGLLYWQRHWHLLGLHVETTAVC